MALKKKPYHVLPAPEGVSIEIPTVWQDGTTADDIKSLTEPHFDQNVIEIYENEIRTLMGDHGPCKVNFEILAQLEKLGYRACVDIGMAWDPRTHKTAPLVYHSNLKSAATVSAEYRESFLPQYPYLRAVGDHTLVIMARLAEDRKDFRGNWDDNTYETFNEFPHIGDIAFREIKVRVLPGDRPVVATPPE